MKPSIYKLSSEWYKPQMTWLSLPKFGKYSAGLPGAHTHIADIFQLAELIIPKQNKVISPKDDETLPTSGQEDEIEEEEFDVDDLNI